MSVKTPLSEVGMQYLVGIDRTQNAKGRYAARKTPVISYADPKTYMHFLT